MFLDEVVDRIDPSRVHFTGWLPQADCFRVMQISSAHVHLTYPFTLSWSPVEALSAGCLVIGSDTPPVREIINGENGILVPFFDFDQLAARVIEALVHPQRFTNLREQARRTALEHYDMRDPCLPALLAFLRGQPTPGNTPRTVA